ncbi:peptidase T [Brachyspira alvinipulli]|uniref:peptidase T n=1 Tax=Brachyspira alvinipulli TaxID=84379 RepID=UPI003003D1E5
MLNDDIKKFQIDSFFKYVSIPSQSIAGAKTLPSSEGQMKLAKVLAEDLKSFGLKDVVVNENAIVTALLPKNKDNTYAIGFVSHLDTVDIGLTGYVHPQILKFKGEDLCLNKEKNIIFKVSDHPEINNYMNNDIIFSDGTSVLGADNKAAIATIMSTLKYIIDNNIEHGDIYIAFVPDEEIGLLGSKALDLTVFKPDFAYTIDSCEIGEVVYETFNAGSASIDIEGVTAHPMSAKGVLVNPILIAIDMANEFDRKETPENTEKKEGYIWVQGIGGNQRNAYLKLNIRDHNKKLYEEKKHKIIEVVEKYKRLEPRAKIELTIEDVYGNIADSIKDDRFAIDVIYEAMRNLNIEPKTISMRGGTDGSALSVKGLFTPNYFTGAHNFHSIYEFLPIPSFHKSLEITLEIIRIVSNSNIKQN